MTLTNALGAPDQRDARRLAQLGVEVRKAEDSTAIHEVEVWAAARKARTDLDTRAELVEDAVELDLKLFQKGMALAAGDPVMEELVLRYLQDQNSANRTTITRSLG